MKYLKFNTQLILIGTVRNPYLKSNHTFYIMYDTNSHKTLIYDWKAYKRLIVNDIK